MWSAAGIDDKAVFHRPKLIHRKLTLALPSPRLFNTDLIVVKGLKNDVPATVQHLPVLRESPRPKRSAAILVRLSDGYERADYFKRNVVK